MKRRPERQTLPLVPTSHQLSNPLSALQKYLCGRGPERHHDGRSNGSELPNQKLPTRFRLGWLRFAVFRRTATHGIADVDLPAIHPHCFDHAIEEFSRPAHERPSRHILVGSRRLAYECNEGRILVAFPKDRLSASSPKPTRSTNSQTSAKYRQRWARWGDLVRTKKLHLF